MYPGHLCKWFGLLSVIKGDGVLGGDGIHHPVGEGKQGLVLFPHFRNNHHFVCQRLFVGRYGRDRIGGRLSSSCRWDCSTDLSQRVLDGTEADTNAELFGGQ